ncbi:MAG: filamentous hemagglutinin N-terminal domain-containing protein, partial [candidate division Zixibacteria bacterium]|nr:filamentous hemagglutinin N-terminal domain-containing protein [candidate division Zixibacteria bacterium]
MNTYTKTKTTHTRRFLHLALAALMILFPSIPAGAVDPTTLPTGGQVTSGTGAISQSGSAMTINQQTGKLTANWDSFNIGRDASVTFQQPGASSVALNRILDQNPSQIYGSLTANGQVFLLNSAGIYFSPTAQVNVGGLVASTLSLSDENFLSGSYTFEGSTGSIVNKGTINGGYIAFLSPTITNAGDITADGGTVAMAAGNKVSLDFTGDSLVSFTVDRGVIDALIENNGLIRADGGAVMMTAESADELTGAVVNNTGVIRARTLNNVEGRILLLADMETGGTKVGGTLDASAPDGGGGGFIETSAAKVTIKDGLEVTTAAIDGETGTWLIDPTDFTIADSGGDITGTALGTLLGSNSITIHTGTGTDTAIDHYGSTGTNGDIFVNDSITWSANKLTLNADRNIEINSALYGSDTAQLALYYGQGTVASGNTATYSINAPVNLAAGDNFSTSLGSDGTVVDYHVITSLGSEGSTSATDLQGMSDNLTGNYVLGADIDASSTSAWDSGAGFSPIGISNVLYYSGVFDGLGHTITDLTINRASTQFVGLFGYTNGATIANVGLVGGTVTGDTSVGGLVGCNYSGTVTGSYATGFVTGWFRVGGLVGWNEGSITNSYATGTVTATRAVVGGLVGMNDSDIAGCYATGLVKGGSHVGGLAGYNSRTVTGSYATGKVEGGTVVGGLVGHNSSGSITNSYATGTVTATSAAVGGLLGSNYNGTVTGSFWDRDTTGQITSLGSENSCGKTTAEMKSLATFSSWSIDDKGGTSSTWRIYDGYTYPLLRSFLAAATATVSSPAAKVYNTSTTVTGGSYAWSTTVDTNDISGTAAYTSAGKNAGTQAVTLGGLYSNQQGYDIRVIDGSIDIAKKAITATGITADDKVYNGNTTATLNTDSAVITNGASADDDNKYYTGDVLVLNTTGAAGSFADKNAGTDKLVTVSGLTLSGADAGNYTISDASGATADITPRSVTVEVIPDDKTAKELTVAVTADNKTYDGNTAATVSDYAFTGLVGDETLTGSNTIATFDTKNVGTGKTVTVSGISIADGTGLASNYTLASTTDTCTADITAKELTVAVTADNKTYDRNTAATVSDYAFTGLVGDETLTGSNTIATFDTKNVGTGKTVTVSG